MHKDLLDQAVSLAMLGAKKPKQANLRRHSQKSRVVSHGLNTDRTRMKRIKTLQFNLTL